MLALACGGRRERGAATVADGGPQIKGSPLTER